MTPCLQPSGLRLNAALLACLLGSMLILGGAARPPSVAISSLDSVETGTVVRVSGLLVSLWRHDGGSETLVLTDPIDGSSLKVVCTRGIAAFPGTYLHIGDEVLVRGELVDSGPLPTIFALSEAIELLRPSDSALSVKSLCLYWSLFENDRFNVTGSVFSEDGPWLMDIDTEHRVPVRLAAGTNPLPEGARVIADCTLCFDESRVLIYLLVWSLSPL